MRDGLVFYINRSGATHLTFTSTRLRSFQIHMQMCAPSTSQVYIPHTWYRVPSWKVAVQVRNCVPECIPPTCVDTHTVLEMETHTHQTMFLSNAQGYTTFRHRNSFLNVVPPWGSNARSVLCPLPVVCLVHPIL